MFFCPQCENKFNMEKTTKSLKNDKCKDHKKIINDILANKKISVVGVIIENLQNDEYFNVLTNEDKKKVLDYVNGAEDEDRASYAIFACPSCNYRKPVEPGTVIYTTNADDEYKSPYSQNMKYSQILPHTRNYICKNKNCESHKNPEKREAKFYRKNKKYDVVYICTTCETYQ